MYLEDGRTEAFGVNVIAIYLYPLQKAKDMWRGVNTCLISRLFKRMRSLQSDRSLSISPSHMDRFERSLRIA